MIDSYGFGKIIVDKVPFDGDLIVFPDRVQPDWRRKEGHLLRWEDLRDSIRAFVPETLVIGRGKLGMMRIDGEFSGEIRKMKITLHAVPTDKAVKVFNRLLLSGSKVMGAFHLTC